MDVRLGIVIGLALLLAGCSSPAGPQGGSTTPPASTEARSTYQGVPSGLHPASDGTTPPSSCSFELSQTWRSAIPPVTDGSVAAGQESTDLPAEVWTWGLNLVVRPQAPSSVLTLSLAAPNGTRLWDFSSDRDGMTANRTFARPASGTYVLAWATTGILDWTMGGNWLKCDGPRADDGRYFFAAKDVKRIDCTGPPRIVKALDWARSGVEPGTEGSEPFTLLGQVVSWVAFDSHEGLAGNWTLTFVSPSGGTISAMELGASYFALSASGGTPQFFSGWHPAAGQYSYDWAVTGYAKDLHVLVMAIVCPSQK